LWVDVACLLVLMSLCYLWCYISKRIEDWSAFEVVGCGCLQVKNTLEEHLLKGSDDDRFPLTPQRIVADLR
jgi:hypothetical protein